MEEVRELLDSPIMCLLGARVSRTRANIINECQCVKTELRAPTGRGWYGHDYDCWNLRTHSKGKEGLPQTDRPFFIPAVRPDHPKIKSLSCTTRGSNILEENDITALEKKV